MAHEFLNKMFLVCMEYFAVVFLMHNKFIDNYRVGMNTLFWSGFKPKIHYNVSHYPFFHQIKAFMLSLWNSLLCEGVAPSTKHSTCETDISTNQNRAFKVSQLERDWDENWTIGGFVEVCWSNRSSLGSVSMCILS